MAQIDRTAGLVGNTAIKAPCACATTANITLNGEQTIDGVTTSSDRVLVKNQTNAVENGIYDSDSGAWTRAKDWNGARDIAQGTIVTIVAGTVNNKTCWRVTTALPVIGTSSLDFERGTYSTAGEVSADDGSSGSIFTTVQGFITKILSSTGAGIVGFIRTEAGAVARFLLAKLRDTASVKDFGASGDGVTDDTAAIKAALKSGVGRILFPPGTYLCDPISFGTGSEPTLATKTLIGDATGYLAALSTTAQNLVTIKCRTAGTIFWQVTLAHRLRMDGITLDANNLCSTTYKLTSYCTNHEYNGCSFINATAGGDNVIIGDAVNLQAEMATFRMCFFTNTNSVKHSRNVYITGSNQINNAFISCRFINADYHIWFANGCQTTLIELCDFYAYTNMAIFAGGSSTYTIRNNYTESSTGTNFFSESSVVYATGSQGMCLLENNYGNTANSSITVSPNHQVVIRGNRIGGTLTVSAPTTANAYYPTEIHNNQYAALVDSSNVGRRWNNMDGGVGQDADAGELIAVGVGTGTGAADTYRKYKRPIQINTGSIYSSSAGNFNLANNCNAGGDNAALVPGYAQSISMGGASGSLSLLASTAAAAATGDLLTLVGALVDGSNSAVRPHADNVMLLGRATFRWTYVHAYNVRTHAVAVSALPAAGTAGAGTRAFVSDATATTFASIVAGGGANPVPVYSDGTNWRIG